MIEGLFGFAETNKNCFVVSGVVHFDL